jgi:hypothetical protein
MYFGAFCELAAGPGGGELAVGNEVVVNSVDFSCARLARGARNRIPDVGPELKKRARNRRLPAA